MDSDYAKDVLVSPDWLAEHIETFGDDDPAYRLIEADKEYDEAYAETHIPNAIGLRWNEDLQDSTERDLLKKEDFEQVMGEHGITEDTTVVIYSDEHNQWAAYTYWEMKYYGHDDVRLLDGGRDYWFDNDYPATTEEPSFTEREYNAAGPFEDIRTYRDGVNQSREQDVPLVDVRSHDEFVGDIIAPPDSKETAQRAGHIPGAQNISWSENVGDDYRFKSRDDLEQLYDEYGVEDDGAVVTYCRIGERSSLTWFSLHELLGYDSVLNYDGSWTEWGSMVRSPIETGE